MARPEKIGTRQSAVTYRGLRDWLEQVEKLGELLKVNGAHWDREMGAITQMLTEGGKGKAPAILFDEVPGYPKGYRTLYGQVSTIKRVALTLGLPLQYEYKVGIVKAYHHRMTEMKLIKPKVVKTGSIFDNVLEGDKVNVLKLPVPIHHQADTHRYIGTADMCITKDPDAEWYNFGAYCCQVYDEKTVGCQITEGKHGRIHRDKYFERGQSAKFAIVCGQDPLLYLLSASPLPSGVSEYDFAGGIRGEPVEVVKGPFTGFPIPADAEIVIEGEAVPGQTKPEGPFGEWMGYYSDDVDCSDMDQVLWAMGTRFDPVTDLDIVQKAWSSGRDPMFLPGNFNNRILIDACIPYNRKLRGEFPKVVEVPEDYRTKMKSKFPQAFKSQS